LIQVEINGPKDPDTSRKKRFEAPYLVWMLFIFTSITLSGQNHLALTSGKVSFESKAPLERIRAFTTEIKGLINPEKRTFAINISNNSFDGFNSPLQREHFLESYIESDKHPFSSFKGKIIETIDFTKDGSHEVRAKGILNIHGVEQERIIKVKIAIKNGKVQVFSNFTILLADHRIAIPTIVNQKISESISIVVEAIFETGKTK